MNVRPVVSVVLALSFSFSLPGQQVVQEDGGSGQPAGAIAFKQEIERQIERFESAARKSEASHASDLALGKIYGQLGLLYEDAAQWERSESMTEHAVKLLRRDAASKSELAKAISQLASLHIVMGKLRESEKEEGEALRLGQELGDKLQIARSWDDFAALSLARHKYERARDFAHQAVAEFVANEQSEPHDVIFSRYTLALADCHLRDYSDAIPLLRASIDEARAKMQGQDLPVGFGEFLLGYALWKSGDSSAANGHLEKGIAMIREKVGWEHPVYLRVLGYYAQFLRETRRMEAANDVERQIRQAEAVVDVRALGTRSAVNGFDGLR